VTCPEATERIEAILDGTLPPSERAQIDAHLAGCPACAAELARSRAAVELTRASVLAASEGSHSHGESEALVQMFRAHGHHGTSPRVADVPLGILSHRAAEGDHIAYLAETEAEIEASAGFLRAGFDADEVGLLLGHEESIARTLQALRKVGLDPNDLTRAGRLHTVAGTSGGSLLAEVGGRISEAVTQGLPRVRVLASLGWDRPGWPKERELLRLEAETTEAIRRLPTLAMCVYDLRALSPHVLQRGALECHPWTLQRGELRENTRRIPADEFLEGL